jgi:Putative Ig domain
MRNIRFLLLLFGAAAIAGVFATSAKAIAFNDTPCRPDVDPTIHLCPSGETGKSYSLQIEAHGGCDVYTWTNPGGGLPPGLSLGSAGLISGTPTTAGKYVFWLQIQDTIGVPASWCTDDHASQRQFEIDIAPGLQIQQRQSRLPGAQLNQAYNLQFTATGGSSLTWSVASGSLPAGLTLNSSTGLLSGTPTAVGDYHFQIRTTDGNRSDVQTYDLSVVEPLRITKFTPIAEVGRPFDLTLAATGGKAPYTWSATGVPAGLTFDASTGKITGTPTAATAATVKVTVTDSVGVATSMTVSLAVVDRLTVKRGALPAAKVGSIYSFRLATVGGAHPFSWTALRGLPAGIKLNARTGRLYGTAKKAGTYRFRVQVADALGAHASLGMVLKVVAGGVQAHR